MSPVITMKSGSAIASVLQFNRPGDFRVSGVPEQAKIFRGAYLRGVAELQARPDEEHGVRCLRIDLLRNSNCVNRLEARQSKGHNQRRHADQATVEFQRPCSRRRTTRCTA